MSTASPKTTNQSAWGRGEVNECDYFVEQQLDKTRLHVKLVDLFGGLMTMAGAALLIMLAAAVVDAWIFDLGVWGRTAVLCVLIVGAICYCVLHLVPMLLRRVSPAFAARMLEQNRPTLQNSLINFVFFRGARTSVSNVVYDAIRRQAATDLSQLEIESSIDRSKLVRLGIVLAAIVMLCGVYTVWSPKNPLSTVARVIAPWADIERPHRVRFGDLDPGDTEVYYGQSVTVSTPVYGLYNDETVTLFYSTADGQKVDQPIAMSPSDSPGSWEAQLSTSSAGLQQDVFYRLEAGDARTPDYHVKVTIAPTILVDHVEYDYPAYTLLERQVVEREPNLRAPEGTWVTLRARTNLDFKHGFIEFDPPAVEGKAPAKVLPLEKVGPREALVRFPLELLSDGVSPKYANYRLTYRTATDDANLNPLVHTIAVQPDLKPEVEVLQPLADPAEVPENGAITIELRGVDTDYALSGLLLKADSSKGAVLDIALFENIAGENGQQIAKYVFRPNSLGLHQGDEIIYYGVAQDNRTTLDANPAERGRDAWRGVHEPNIARTKNFRLEITAPLRKSISLPDPDREETPTEPGETSDAASDSTGGGEKGATSAAGSKGDESKGSPNNATDSKKPKADDSKSESGKGDSENGDAGSDSEKGSGDSDSKSGDSDSSDMPENSGESEAGESGADQGLGGGGDDEQGDSKQQGGAGASGSASGGQSAGEAGGDPSQNGSQGGGQPGQNPSGSSGDSPGERTGEAGGADGEFGQGEPGDGEPLHDGEVIERLLELQKQLEKAKQQQQGSKASGGGGEAPSSDGASSQESDNSGDSSQGQPSTQQNQSPPSGENAPGEGAGQPMPKQGAGQGSQNQADGGGQSPPMQGGQPNQGQKGTGDQPSQGAGAGQPSSEQGPQSAGSEQGAQQTAGQSGAEQSSDSQGGSTGSQGDNQEGKKPESGGGEESGASSPSISDKKSGATGGADGDRSGAGGKGGGQGAQGSGGGNSGSTDAADQGSEGANEAGEGQATRAGGDQKATGETGASSKNQTGAGGESREGSTGSQQKSPPQDPQQQDQSQQKQTDADPKKAGDSAGRSGGSSVGGGGGMSDTAIKPNGKPGEESTSEDANVEYARKAADLALEYLKNHGDESTSKELGMTPAELAAFAKKWEAMKRAAVEPGSSGRRELDESLRSLGLRPQADRRRQASSKNDDLKGLRDQGSRTSPPESYLEQFRAFKRGAARE